MRVIGEIAHPLCKITIFQWNSKYLIKLEQGLLEQTYKIDETEVTGDDDIQKIMNEDFIETALARFRDMHLDLVRAMEKL